MMVYKMPKTSKRLYLLVKNVDAHIFRTLCDEAMESGWEPLGGVSIEMLERLPGTPDGGIPYVVMYAQAFIKDFPKRVD